MRLFIASLVSSFSIVPLYFSILALSGDLSWGILAGLLLAAWLVAVVAVCCLALPLHLVLAARGQTHVLYYLIAGFLPPALVTYVVRPFGDDGGNWIFWQAAVLGGLGALVALIFWGIATGGRRAE